MESAKFIHNLPAAMRAPRQPGVLRFYRQDTLIAQKDSRNIQIDLLLVAEDWSSPLRQATAFSYEIFHFV